MYICVCVYIYVHTHIILSCGSGYYELIRYYPTHLGGAEGHGVEGGGGGKLGVLGLQ